MTSPSDPDRRIRDYLDEGPSHLPDRSYEAVSARVHGSRLSLGGTSRRRLGSPVDLRVAVAGAAALVLAVAAFELRPSDGAGVGSPSPDGSGGSPSPVATPIWDTGTEYSSIDPGRLEVPWSGGQIRLTVPTGWLRADAGFGSCIPGWPSAGAVRFGVTCSLPQGRTTLTRFPLEGNGTRLSLSIDHDVERVPLTGCWGAGADAGASVEDLVSALELRTRGTIVGPSDLTISGYAAKALVVIGGPCVTKEGHPIWQNTTTHGFEVPSDGVGRVWVVDVDGRRLVITSVARDASSEDLAEVEAMIASIEIEPRSSPAPLTTEFDPGFLAATGRYGMTVAGVRLSVEVSTDRAGNTGWGSPAPFYFAKSIRGPQGAEAAIMFTSFPDATYPYACFDVLGLDAGDSAADLAAAVAAAPDDPIDPIGPVDVTVGGRPAVHVAFTIGSDTGCRPAFFFRWLDLYGGPLWGGGGPGDTIRVWIVDVDGTLLFIEGMTTTEATAELIAELGQFIESIRFE